MNDEALNQLAQLIRSYLDSLPRKSREALLHRVLSEEEEHCCKEKIEAMKTLLSPLLEGRYHLIGVLFIPATKERFPFMITS